MLAIAANTFDKPSETFIRVHVTHVAPGRTVLICSIHESKSACSRDRLHHDVEDTMHSELIIATYNKPTYLALCLSTAIRQVRKPDSICIADDGSDHRTRDVIERVRAACPGFDIRHCWHEDDGFRKSAALNKAVASSSADYLIFIDDDCLLHPAFVRRHLQLARLNRFLTGSLIRLSEEFTAEVLETGQVRWSAKQRPVGWAPRDISEYLKSMPGHPMLLGALDMASPVRKNWQGACSSTFKRHLVAVNGFDETMAYGGLDKELGARLVNSGVKGRHIRYTAPVYHLDHSRSYEDPDVRKTNRQKIEQTRKQRSTWAVEGLVG
jgi:glycosyltransferase involved in cell wall biosynthesis